MWLEINISGKKKLYFLTSTTLKIDLLIFFLTES